MTFVQSDCSRKLMLAENLFFRTNWSSERDKPNREVSSKRNSLGCAFKDGQHSKWDSGKLNLLEIIERLENVQKSRLCFNCFFRHDQHSKDCKGRTLSKTNYARRHKKWLGCKLLGMKINAVVLDSNTSVATEITHGRQPAVRIKLTLRNFSSKKWFLSHILIRS